MKFWIKFFVVIYMICVFGLVCNKVLFIVCIKCVLFKLVGLYKNKGLCWEVFNWVKILWYVLVVIWFEWFFIKSEKENKGFNCCLWLFLEFFFFFFFFGCIMGVGVDFKVVVVVVGCLFVDKIVFGCELIKILILCICFLESCFIKIVISFRWCFWM